MCSIVSCSPFSLVIIVYLILSNLIKLSFDCIKLPKSAFCRKGQRLNFPCANAPFRELYISHFLGFALSTLRAKPLFGTVLINQGLTAPTQGTLATSKKGTLPIFPYTSITYKFHKVPFFPIPPKITPSKKELYQPAFSYRPVSVLAVSTTLYVTPFSNSRNVTHNN